MSTANRPQHWAGVVSRDGSSPDALLDRMVGARAGTGFNWRGERSAVALGPELARSDFLIARVDRVLLALDGRLDNRVELAHLLSLPRNAPLAQILAQAYREFGFDLPQHLTGDFALVVHDSVLSALLLARDVVGTRPLYYAEAGGSIAFAPALEPLRHALTRSAVPRLHAVAQLLCAPETLQSDETFLSGMRALPPAHVLISTATGTRVREYWKADGSALCELDFRGCVEEYRALFRQSVKRRLATSGRTAVLVSGGLDSASLFCLAHEAGGAVLGLHQLGQNGSANGESPYISLLEQSGRRIERLPASREDYRQTVADNVRESEAPLVGSRPALTARAAHAARASGAAVLLHGAWADEVLFPVPPAYLIDALRLMQWPQLLRHLHRLPRWVQNVSPVALYSTVAREIALSRLPRLLRMMSGRRVERLLTQDLQTVTRAEPWPVASWSEQRSAHASSIERSLRSRVATLELESYAKCAARHALPVSLPFLDRDLLTLLIAAPGMTQNQDGIPKAIMRASMRGIVPDGILEHRIRNSSGATNALNGSAQQVFDELRGGRVVSYGFLNAEPFSRDLGYFARQAQASAARLPALLTSLFSVECWLRRFCAA